jgi:hypothetical protein
VVEFIETQAGSFHDKKLPKSSEVVDEEKPPAE